MTQKLVNASINGTWQILRDRWGRDPMMVFSVIGDSVGMVPKPWPVAVLQDALLNAAKNAGESWILCGRGDLNISRIVMDAFGQYQRHEFMSVRPDPSTGFKHSKLKKEQSGNTPCLRLITIGHDADYLSELPDQEGMSFTTKSFPFPGDISEIGCTPSYKETFWFDLEVFFWKQRVKRDFEMRLPLVVLVAEGDFETIEHVRKLVSAGIPVIIMKGSGRAADLITAYLNEDGNISGDGRKTTVSETAVSLFGVVFSPEKLRQLEGIKKNQKMIRIFDVENDDPLLLTRLAGEAIVAAWSEADISHTKTKGEAVLAKLVARGIQEVEQRSYVIESSKFTSPESLPLFFYVGFQLYQEEGDEEKRKLLAEILLLESLKWNRADYVEVLLDTGVALDLPHIATLYKTTLACSSCEPGTFCNHMQWILTKCNKEAARIVLGQNEEEHNAEIAVPNDGTATVKASFVFAQEEERKRKIKNAKDVISCAMVLCHELLGYTGKFKDTRYDSKDDEEGSRKKKKKNPKLKVTDLLLWSVFANRPELTRVLWRKSESHLLTCFVIQALTGALSEEARNVKEHFLAKSLNEHKQIYEKRSLAMLDHLYQLDPETAITVAGNKTSIWFIKAKPLHFAYENFMYDITSHTCSQRYMNKKWYNNLPPSFFQFLKFPKYSKKLILSAPLMKFLVNYFFFTVMLCCYSTFVMTSIDDTNYSSYGYVYEYFVYIWAAGDFIEEVKIALVGTFSGGSHISFRQNLWRYLNNFWNISDILSYVMLIIALPVRHSFDPYPYIIARRTFSVSLLFMFIRYLQVFLVSKRLGPLLIMIKEMLKDLLLFLSIAIIFIIGIGIYYHANLYPNHTQMFGNTNYWQKWNIWKILYYPYWQLYGEINLEYLEVDDPHANPCSNMTSVYSNDPLIQRCPEEDPTVPIVAAIYMLVSNLLLVNLVIAMFSHTFESVMVNSEKLWHFTRYAILLDYEEKIPSPCNLLLYPFRLFRRCIRKIRRRLCTSKEKILAVEDERKHLGNHLQEIQRISALRC